MFVFLVVTRKKAEEERKHNKLLEEPSIDEWLAKRNKRLKREDTPDDNLTGAVNFVLPPFLNIPNLPPSLLPPTEEELNNKPLCEWG